MSHSVAQWSNAIMMQMPQGDIWSRDQSGPLYKYVAGYAPRLQRAERSADQLLLEMRPNSTQQLLEYWEEYLGLPECVLSDQTFETRRRAVIEKYYRKGGLQSWAIEELATTLGYTVEVNEIFPHHCLRGCTYPLYEERYRHVIQVIVKNISNNYASCLDDCLTPLVSESAALLNCTLNKFKLAGKYYEFIYEEAA
jgi:uncharacterized protein YmfQ (DUF2313 family)